uniref:Alpha-carbonic anhydrase domain-containing protein n=1 Tax=Eptatretus burgeri TaxID=7764 RepID=A0A8C4N937_EPTBU
MPRAVLWLFLGACLLAGYAWTWPRERNNRERNRSRSSSGGQTWAYTGSHGPLLWPKIFPECDGPGQSPVNILSAAATSQPTFGPLRFRGWTTASRDSRIHNDGTTVNVHLSGDYFLSDGGLDEQYRASWMTFHWGECNATGGSEHWIDHRGFPLEMQIYAHSGDFSTFEAAVKGGAKLAALSIMFELSKQKNRAYNPIVEGMRMVSQPEVDKLLPPFRPSDLLPAKLSDYFRYSGSLTVPPCTSDVAWTVFAEPVTISMQQLRAFCGVMIMERTDSAIMLDYLQNNYRPLQPHYRGPLYRSFTPKATVNFAGNPTSAALTLRLHHSRDCSSEPRIMEVKLLNGSDSGSFILVTWERPLTVPDHILGYSVVFGLLELGGSQAAAARNLTTDDEQDMVRT